MIIDVRKFYVRRPVPGMPASQMHYAATCGFYELGIEVEHLNWHDEFEDTCLLEGRRPGKFADLAPDVGVFGYITDVWAALDRVRRPHPPSIDYPYVLNRFLGRVIGRTCLGRVRSTLEPTFVKPVQHKLFTGFVHLGDGESRMRIVTQPDSVEVWTSHIVEFRSEYRVFILGDEILDVRRYKGDWNLVPNNDVAHAAVKAWTGRPAACCLDFGVTADGRTLLVEANDGFSFGTYGLDPKLYVRMLAARWRELMEQPELPAAPKVEWTVTIGPPKVI